MSFIVKNKHYLNRNDKKYGLTNNLNLRNLNHKSGSVLLVYLLLVLVIFTTVVNRS